MAVSTDPLQPLQMETMVDLGTTQPGEAEGADLIALTTYNNLIAQGNYADAARYVAPGGEGQILQRRLFDAAKWNTIITSLKDTQQFFNNSIDDYIYDIEQSVNIAIVIGDQTTQRYVNDLVINYDTFLTRSGGTIGTYTFVYSSVQSLWILNSGTGYTLAQWGMTTTITNPANGDKIEIKLNSVGGRINNDTPSSNTVYSSLKTEEVLQNYSNRVRVIANSNLSPLIDSIMAAQFIDGRYKISNTDLKVWADDPNFEVTDDDYVIVNFTSATQALAGAAGIMCESTNAQGGGIYLYLQRSYSGFIGVESIEVVKA